jgi:hypothetical protein
MTQIITAITKEYVLLVADRRLTFLNGPKQGELADDDTCKLVSLCNTCGIGYTGLAQIEGIPTHEWIAKALASEQCSDPANASRILLERARVALSSVPLLLRRQTFVIAGWAYFENMTGLRSHVCAVTNMVDVSGRMLSTRDGAFHVLLSALPDGEDLAIHVVGQPLLLVRGQHLERNLRKLITREISARAALRLLVDEIIHTSGLVHAVGKRVLGLCIPRRAAQSTIESGQSMMIAMQPTEDAASSFYYDPTYSELQQFGPTITCGGFAATDVKTENDPSIDYQSSKLRVLALPKGTTQSEPTSTPIFKKPRVGGPIISFEFGISVDNAVAPGSVYAIPAAIKNTGDVPIVFAQDLSDKIGQEVPPSVQGGAVPAITFSWPTGDWSIGQFAPVSRTKFAGVALAPGDVLKFDFGSFTVPKAPMGSMSLSSVLDLSIRFTDTIIGQLLSTSGPKFRFPTKVGPTLRFRIDAKSASSGLSFRPARVIDTATGELISGPVDGSPPAKLCGPVTDTSISSGKPGVGMGSSSSAEIDIDNDNAS